MVNMRSRIYNVLPGRTTIFSLDENASQWILAPKSLNQFFVDWTFVPMVCKRARTHTQKQQSTRSQLKHALSDPTLLSRHIKMHLPQELTIVPTRFNFVVVVVVPFKNRFSIKSFRIPTNVQSHVHTHSLTPREIALAFNLMWLLCSFPPKLTFFFFFWLIKSSSCGWTGKNSFLKIRNNTDEQRPDLITEILLIFANASSNTINFGD